jgi:hypothetical protein
LGGSIGGLVEESGGISMNRFCKVSTTIAVAAFGLLVGAAASAVDVKIKLSGAEEVPPVQTQASGSGTITVADDGSVSGSVSISGVEAKAAHIHMGDAGTAGPVVIPLVKDGDSFKVAAGAKLNAEQRKAFIAGGLYVNVHSAAHPSGEIRGQIK